MEAAVQYIRPEIIGLVLGATLAALIFGEFKARATSASFVYFILGVFTMIGALVFQGCPLRALLQGGKPRERSQFPSSLKNWFF